MNNSNYKSRMRLSPINTLKSVLFLTTTYRPRPMELPSAEMHKSTYPRGTGRPGEKCPSRYNGLLITVASVVSYQADVSQGRPRPA